MKANIQKIDIILEIHDKLPTFFNTDQKRLKQILLNLIGNSLKFTTQGYVKIEALPIEFN